jgi:subtilisin-like proprotein convertase family protein
MRRTILLLSTITAGLMLAGGVALAATKVVTKTFTNPNQINIVTSEINEAGQERAAEPYPSTIIVRGFHEGRIRDVNLKLIGLSHTWPDDVGVLLVGPRGQKALVISDVGADLDVSGILLTLDDEAQDFLPDSAQLTAGTFKPTQGTTGPADDEGFAVPANFPSPAPSGPYRRSLSVFDGTNPNGTWNLFVLDDSGFDAGSLGAWKLRIKARVTD